jgi:hypothetical protein
MDPGNEQVETHGCFPHSSPFNVPKKYVSRLEDIGGLASGIPYPVRDKLLNDLQKNFFNILLRFKGG